MKQKAPFKTESGNFIANFVSNDKHIYVSYSGCPISLITGEITKAPILQIH